MRENSQWMKLVIDQLSTSREYKRRIKCLNLCPSIIETLTTANNNQQKAPTIGEAKPNDQAEMVN